MSLSLTLLFIVVAWIAGARLLDPKLWDKRAERRRARRPR